MANVREPGTPPKKGAGAVGYKSAYVKSRPASPLRWSDIPGDYLIDMLDALQSAGDAALLGTTMDGGALVICVCSGTERVKFYPSSAEEATKTIREITDAANGLSGR